MRFILVPRVFLALRLHNSLYTYLIAHTGPGALSKINCWIEEILGYFSLLLLLRAPLHSHFEPLLLLCCSCYCCCYSPSIIRTWAKLIHLLCPQDPQEPPRITTDCPCRATCKQPQNWRWNKEALLLDFIFHLISPPTKMAARTHTPLTPFVGPSWIRFSLFKTLHSPFSIRLIAHGTLLAPIPSN